MRVSRYPDQRHVRFSVRDGSGTAESAVSLDVGEALRLAGFVAPPPRPRRSRVHDLLERALRS